MKFLGTLLAIVAVCASESPARAAEFTAIEAFPPAVKLSGSRARQQVVVVGKFATGETADLTATARYESKSAAIAAVDSQGLIVPRSAGTTQITIKNGTQETHVDVTVEGLDVPDPVDFRLEAIAALSRAGCSQGACHGSPQGKGGFRMSLRGYDPDVDILTLVREAGGRRIDRMMPDDSLILKKGSAQIAHVGGVRFRKEDAAYQTLRQWVADGAPDAGVVRKLVKLEVVPGARRLHTDHPRQQLVALAHFDDGSIRDVTPLAVFTSNPNSAFEVGGEGLVKFSGTAEAVVLVRYLEKVSSVRLTYVKIDSQYVYRGPKPANFVDEFVSAKQKLLQLQPAAEVEDAAFMRRVHLDLIGTLPTAEEAREFLDSKAADKRAQLIDRLLERDEYAQFWALKWADVMRGSRETISERGVHSFHRYLVRRFADDRSFADTAREIVTGTGNTLYRPEANFYRIAQTPEDAAESMAQLFLGVRMQCARCHNHPFEAITQTDYYGLAAYFARVKNKGKQFMLDDAVVYLARNGEVQHPLTKKNIDPIAFGTSAGPTTPDDDRRTHLAAWLTEPSNRFFAASTVNRVWFHLLGTGLVEPVDDFRDSNPASHPELLQALADEFAKSGYRFKPVIRAILNSRAYQLSAQSDVKQSPNAAQGDRYFTKAKIRMLTAEQVVDGISTATGLPEMYTGYPKGTKAIELAEGAADHHFLAAFSKPIRDVQCDCAREEEPSLNQVIHLLNNSSLLTKIGSAQSHLGRWLAAGLTTDEVVERIYLATLSRKPSAGERELASKHIATVGDKNAALQDLQHALLNSDEFLLRH
ncbi:MAG: DUF1549 and DUF1553 domain-containing protein [Planctomycetia bacterium]|nr:DUF1549 and DUF1553 domain-containing protein [Planctomycetia bacterium]